ncbi:MAG: DUF2868 domain-containing protein [Gammaproteobacteria bacterium]|nr:DUF2868 domain-containing protein [Gammaproteobacteria bacterium]MCP5425579.1 DUF2868 domain-containing protein [Gammaproteobacteria bacterium]MCP5459021.1 DUF2868 domain-containing protein [Gammaproteobacteria bacterium]
MTSEFKPTDSVVEFSSIPTDGPPDLEQCLLAEAVRLHEEGQGYLDEPDAEAAARAAGGDLQHRIIVRAHALSVAPALTQALHQLRGASTVVVIVALIFVTVAGASLAQLTLGATADGPVNFFWVLGAMLGLHSLALLLWVGLMCFLPNVAATGSLGGLAFAIGRRVTHWLHRGPLPMAAIRAGGLVYGGGQLGRWTLSTISHALWSAYLTGCIVLVLLILSVKQYSFAWETTILSDRTYTTLTRVIAVGPDALGFTTPSSEQIAASHWDKRSQFPGEAREAWSGLLVGSLIAYGLLPRLLLLAFSLFSWRRASRHFRLDLNKRGYARLQTRLVPVAHTLGVVDADTAPAANRVPAPLEQPLDFGGGGPAAIVGFEIDAPVSGWPPAIDGVDWLDLGFVDDRAGRQRVLTTVGSSPTPPRVIVLVCSLTVTPDRGTRAFVHELQQTTRIPVALALTEGQRLRERGDTEQLEQRINDWRDLASGAQVAGHRVVEIDLDHLTDTSRSRLTTLVLGRTAAPRGPGRLPQALDLIKQQAKSWTATPTPETQAELHRAIAQLYQGGGHTWQNLLQTRWRDGQSQLQQMKTSAERMVDLLPARLRVSPRWLAAGAAAGALSCVAAATLVAPAAIAALPAWAGLGAALSTLVRPGTTQPDTAPQPSIDFGTAVCSAALFALLLELQGRDETAISRLLDRIVEAGEPVIEDAEAAATWLDDLKRRFDEAVAAEGGA